MRKYELLLLTPDGEDFQIDYPKYYEEPETIGLEEIKEFSAGLGSKWFFYPFHFIIRSKNRNCWNYKEIENQRVIEAPDCLQFLKNKSIKTVKKFFKENQELIEALLK